MVYISRIRETLRIREEFVFGLIGVIIGNLYILISAFLTPGYNNCNST